MRKALFTAIVVLHCLPSWGAVQTRSIAYRDGDLELEGFLAWDDAVKGKRPAVLVVHEWWGLNEYARGRARMLAELGYAAFAIDMYGKGKVTEHPTEARELAGIVRSNVKSWRARALKGLEVLRREDVVDPTRVAAIGYCFGGATVMQLAYAGADLAGVASFHGSVPVPEKGEVKSIHPKVLICHGAADPFIPETQITAFRAALDEAGADWQIIYYGGARHSFTNPDAGKAGIEGLKYDKGADERSWSHLRAFLGEVFAAKK